MPATGIFLIVVIGVLVGVVVTALVVIAGILRRIIDTLGKVTFGVRAIAARTAPIDPVVSGIAADLAAVAGALQELAAKVAPSERRDPAASGPRQPAS